MLELITDMSHEYKGHAELYKRGDEYLLVSTVDLSAAQLSETERAIVDFVGVVSGLATSGEETIAFPADEHGNVTDYSYEVAIANGPGSRAQVLDQLTKEDS